MERRVHLTAGPLLVIASSLLLAAGFRLNEDPAGASALEGWKGGQCGSRRRVGAGSAVVRFRREGGAADAMREEGAMIRLHQLEKSVRSGAGQLYLLRNIQLTVGRGDFVTLMGPSGAGKSTLLAVLGLLDAEWAGEYEFDGQAIHRLSPKDRHALARKHVGFVFQKYHLLDDLTVAENLEVPLSYRGFSRKEIQARVADALDRFQIVGKKDLYPAQLSGGQQQLVGVARAV